MSAFLLVLGIFFVLASIRLAIAIARARRKLRTAQTVVCPETGAKAAVEIDATHAAWTAALGDAEYRITSCSLGPEWKNCQEPCFGQVESELDTRMGRALPIRGSEPSACAVCGETVGEIRWSGDRLESALGAAAARPPDRIGTGRRLCWECHVADTFGRLPVLVADEPESGG